MRPGSRRDVKEENFGSVRASQHHACLRASFCLLPCSIRARLFRMTNPQNVVVVVRTQSTGHRVVWHKLFSFGRGRQAEFSSPHQRCHFLRSSGTGSSDFQQSQPRTRISGATWCRRSPLWQSALLRTMSGATAYHCILLLMA